MYTLPPFMDAVLSEQRQLMKWVGIFQVRIFRVGIFPGAIFLEPVTVNEKLFKKTIFSKCYIFFYLFISLHLLFDILKLHVTSCVCNIQFNDFYIVYSKKLFFSIKSFFLQTMPPLIKIDKSGVSHLNQILNIKKLGQNLKVYFNKKTDFMLYSI